MNMKTNRNSGFTVTELLVVCAIIGIMGFSAFINVIARAPYFRMDDARIQIINDLRAARQNAVSRSAPVYVSFSSSAKSYTIWIDANRNGSVDSGEQTTKTLPNYNGLTMSVSPDSGNFSALGTWSCSSTVEMISLTLSPVGTQKIYVTPSGEVGSDS